MVYPDALRARIVGIAEREWVLFGQPAVSYMAFAPVLTQSGLTENDHEAFVSVLAYWSILQPHDRRWAGYIASQERAYVEGSGLPWTRTPWSAAFVSYVMLTAGIDPRDFTPNAAHAAYVDDAIARTERYGRRAVYEAMAFDAVRPAPGDLLCSDGFGREGSRSEADPVERRVESLAAFRALPRAARLARAMHCDIVWKVDVDARVLYAIGGNVADGVAQSAFPLDERGCPVRRYPPGLRGERTFFALLRLNTRTPMETTPCRP